MRSPARPNPRHLYVTIVSSNQDTLDRLTTYLREAGVAVHGTRRIEGSLEMTPPASSAVVFFPDDFTAHAMDAALADLHRNRPAALPVFVTSDPRRFDGLDRVGHVAPLVMPKPVWGSDLLDAIRDRLDGNSSESENIR